MKCEERHRRLDRDMVGRVIEYELTLKLGPRPSAASRIAFLYSLLS